MVTTFRAKFHNGLIQPLEPIDLAEDMEVVVTVSEGLYPATSNGTLASAGAWKDLLDCEQFEEQIYRNRTLNSRPAVEL